MEGNNTNCGFLPLLVIKSGLLVATVVTTGDTSTVRAPSVFLFDHVIFLLGGAGPTSLAPALVVPSLAAAVDAALAPSEVTLVPGSLVPATKISFAP